MDDLDSQLVRRTDEDRWLASRFAPADVRADLIALYALNYEVARTVEVVSQPTLGDIRLAWWREAIAEIYERPSTPARASRCRCAGAQPQTLAPPEALEDLIAAPRA